MCHLKYMYIKLIGLLHIAAMHIQLAFIGRLFTLMKVLMDMGMDIKRFDLAI